MLGDGTYLCNDLQWTSSGSLRHGIPVCLIDVVETGGLVGRHGDTGVPLPHSDADVLRVNPQLHPAVEWHVGHAVF